MQKDKLLLGLSAVLLLTYTVYVRNKFLCYMILITPLLDMIIASFLLKILPKPWRSSVKGRISTALLSGLLIGFAVLNLSILRIDSSAPNQTIQEQITRVILPGESVMGNQLFWFALYDHNYYSWENLIYYQRHQPRSTLDDAFDQFRPDVLIIDGHLKKFIADEELNSSYFGHLRLPESELKAFLDKKAKLITVINEPTIEPIMVYRINWRAGVSY